MQAWIDSQNQNQKKLTDPEAVAIMDPPKSLPQIKQKQTQRPICVISSVHSTISTNDPNLDKGVNTTQEATLTPSKVKMEPKQKPAGQRFGSRMLKNLSIRINDDDGHTAAADSSSGFGPSLRQREAGPSYKEVGIRSSNQNRYQQHYKSRVEDQYWISCRFCANVFSERGGISLVMKHEEEEHPGEVETSQKSPFYKIFKLKSMFVDAFPQAHPARKPIFSTHPIQLQWPPPPPTTRKSGKKSWPRYGPRGRRVGRWQHHAYTEADLICPHCKKQFKYPSFCRQHMSFCSERPDAVGRGRGIRGRGRGPTLKTCQHCSQTCIGQAGLFRHYKTCALRTRSRRSHTIGEEKNRTCIPCQRTFKYPSMLQAHLRTNCRFRATSRCPPTLTMTICPYCQRNYKFPSALWQHLKICSLARAAAREAGHEDIPVLPGFDLSLIPPTATAETANVPDNEFRAPSPSKPRPRSTLTYLTCELCGHISFSRDGMVNHRNIVHKITTAFVESNTTSDHMAEFTHSNSGASEEGQGQAEALPADRSSASRIYKCRKCFEPFPTRFKMLQHERLHAAAATGRESSEVAAARQDEGTEAEEQQFKCSICPATFALKGTRNKHIQRSHGTSFKKILNNGGGGGGYKCVFCPLVLGSMGARSKHEGEAHREKQLAPAHTPAEPREPPSIEAAGKRKGFSQCRFCPLVLVSDSRRRYHERRMHKPLVEEVDKEEQIIDIRSELKRAIRTRIASKTGGNIHQTPDSDLVIVPQEQEFFLENDEGENEVDPLMLPDPMPTENVDDVIRTNSVKLMKALNDAEPITLHYGGAITGEMDRDHNSEVQQAPMDSRMEVDPPPEEIGLDHDDRDNENQDFDADADNFDIDSFFESMLST